jgi:hypothetical protein
MTKFTGRDMKAACTQYNHCETKTPNGAKDRRVNCSALLGGWHLAQAFERNEERR